MGHHAKQVALHSIEFSERLVDAVQTPDKYASSWKSIYGGDGGYVAIDPTDPGMWNVKYQWANLVRRLSDGTLRGAATGLSDDFVFVTPYTLNVVRAHLTVTIPNVATAGVPIAFTVKALDSFNNTYVGFSDTVAFSGSDRQALELPEVVGPG